MIFCRKHIACVFLIRFQHHSLVQALTLGEFEGTGSITELLLLESSMRQCVPQSVASLSLALFWLQTEKYYSLI